MIVLMVFIPRFDGYDLTLVRYKYDFVLGVHGDGSLSYQWQYFFIKLDLSSVLEVLIVRRTTVFSAFS